jgi:hypothetical protein
VDEESAYIQYDMRIRSTKSGNLYIFFIIFIIFYPFFSFYFYFYFYIYIFFVFCIISFSIIVILLVINTESFSPDVIICLYLFFLVGSIVILRSQGIFLILS